MNDVLDKLKAGVRRFQSEVYQVREAEFSAAAASPQRPHTLFITCADSRIDPNQLTQTGIGELFVTRNIGNLVPAYGAGPDSVDAVIEYAVNGLRVQHIVICGHSDCGAMKALLNPDSTSAMPAVQGWLTNAQAALQLTGTLSESASPGGEAAGESRLLSLVTEQNVLLQLQQLKTHPAVAQATAEGRLNLSGWVYDIGLGQVRIAAADSRQFVPVT